MRTHGYQSYFDNEVLAASPLKLVEMLYDAALDSIAAARAHVRRGEIRARSLAINKAIRIVMELYQCLNHEAGSLLSVNLAGLYGYVVRLLIEANFKQIDTPLAEAQGLLSTLAEGWKACSPAMPNLSFTNGELLQREASANDLSPAAR
jgi:flagellar protein FliS